MNSSTWFITSQVLAVSLIQDMSVINTMPVLSRETASLYDPDTESMWVDLYSVQKCSKTSRDLQRPVWLQAGAWKIGGQRSTLHHPASHFVICLGKCLDFVLDWSSHPSKLLPVLRISGPETHRRAALRAAVGIPPALLIPIPW